MRELEMIPKVGEELMDIDMITEVGKELEDGVDKRAEEVGVYPDTDEEEIKYMVLDD